METLLPLILIDITICSNTMASIDLNDVLDAASDDADSTPPSPPTTLLSPAEQHYQDNNRTMILLATMCIGVRDDDGLLLIDPDIAPWDKLPKKQKKPTLDLLREEIKR